MNSVKEYSMTTHKTLNRIYAQMIRQAQKGTVAFESSYGNHKIVTKKL